MHFAQKLREGLDGLSKDGIITDVDCPTEWISNLGWLRKKTRVYVYALTPSP